MRLNVLFIIVLAVGLTVSPAFSTDEGATGKGKPSAYFPLTHYQFGQKVEGTSVAYEFILENHGDAPLVVKNVRTG